MRSILQYRFCFRSALQEAKYKLLYTYGWKTLKTSTKGFIVAKLETSNKQLN